MYVVLNRRVWGNRKDPEAVIKSYSTNVVRIKIAHTKIKALKAL